MCVLHTRILSVERLNVFRKTKIVELKLPETGKTQEHYDKVKSAKVLVSYLLIRLLGFD